MIEFKPTYERRGWRNGWRVNPTTVYGFKSRRKWLRDNFEGNKIGYKKLSSLGLSYYDRRRYYHPYIHSEDMYRFLYDNLGKTYQEAWEKFLSLVKPNLSKFKKNTKDLEYLFKEELGLIKDWWRRRSGFIINSEGIIDKEGNFEYKPKKVYKKYILVCNGKGEIKINPKIPNKIIPLDKKVYILDPYTDEINTVPVQVFIVPECRWNVKGTKDEILTRMYKRVIVPGWKIKGGYWLVRKKKKQP